MMSAAPEQKRLVRLAFERLEPRSMPAAGGFGVVTFDPGTSDPLALVAALLGSNSQITPVAGSVQYLGAAGQGGQFHGFQFSDTSANIALTLPDGVLLTSGNAADAFSNTSNAVSTVTRSGGDPDLTSLLDSLPGGSDTFALDANALSFQFTTEPGIKSITLRFVFGSDEFPEYLAKSFNDMVGIFVDGRSVGVDASDQPISVKSGLLTLDNSLDHSSAAGTNTSAVDFTTLQYDGLTRQLVLTANLDPNQTVHTFKVAIGDVGDVAVDSAVFLASLTGSTDSPGDSVTEVVEHPTPEPEPEPTPTPIPFPNSTDNFPTTTPPTTIRIVNANNLPAVGGVPTLDGPPASQRFPSSITLVGGGANIEKQSPPIAAVNHDSGAAAPPLGGDVVLATFTKRRHGGDHEQEALLMKLADVEQPHLIAIEYGDEVVKKDVVANKAVVPLPIADAPVVAEADKATAAAEPARRNP